MKVKTSKGFTLAELLIVMAIIVVLAAVAIPTFGKQLETARETGDMEVIRNAYTDALTFAIQDGADGTLDGYIGTPPATAADTAQGRVSHTSNTAGIYTVTVASAATSGSGSAGEPGYVAPQAATRAFAQNGTRESGKEGEWKYVNSTFMGLTVPPVNTATLTLTFKFDFNDDSEVVVQGVGANTDTAGTNLFVAGYGT